jgi:hypothetical protein
LARKPLPKPGFLDTCECLGYVFGERRWRNPNRRLLYTWDGFHGEVEVFDVRGEHLGVVDAVTGIQIKPARKGDEFVSSVQSQALSFFDRYSRGEVAADEIDDYVSEWHRSPSTDQRCLAEFLGMTHQEYQVWIMDPNSLPLILAARQTSRPLIELVTERVAEMEAAGRPSDTSALYALSNWMKGR